MGDVEDHLFWENKLVKMVLHSTSTYMIMTLEAKLCLKIQILW